MKERCYYKKGKSYKNYGGRGITVCDEWLNNLLAFYGWALANGWRRGLQIDRINNDGNYEPNNCRIVSHTDNSRNTRKTKLTVGKIVEIRELHASGIKQTEIAKRFFVGVASINNIVKGRSWRGV